MTADSHPAVAADPAPAATAYAELHALSNFSFQRGASSAQELFQRAAEMGYTALAITDECSLAGIVRALEAAEDTGIALIVGTEVRLQDGCKLVLLAADQTGYSDICRLISNARRRSGKGDYQLGREDVEQLGDGVLLLWPVEELTQTEPTAPAPAPLALPGLGHGMDSRHDPTEATAHWLQQHFAGRAWIAVELHRGADDARQLQRLQQLAARHQLPLVASGDVHMHVRRRRALQDALTAVRLACTVAEAGQQLFANGERHLRRIDELATLYPAALLQETLHIAARCRFSLRDLRYEYPHELVPPGIDASTHLRNLTLTGARRHWPRGIPAKVMQQIDHELSLIRSLAYEHFFLTVEEIVQWARQRTPPILCQGRGSSANSAVCYCLCITAVDPEHGNLLFERFLSIERNEPPDIDVDFEHERREEVIQHIYSKYGRERAALAATVISYRGKSAARDIGRVLGLAEDQLDELSQAFSRSHGDTPIEERLQERGFDADSPLLRKLLVLVEELRGFPRHLSQHVGGFVISEHPLYSLVPVENAAMPDRTIIQWDKNDLETLKLLKVDCLALGMLSCLRRSFELLQRHHGLRLDLARLPQDDAATYAMISKADTIGVFQIESRAQMSMLPRIKPHCFYDLVIQVAIVRPGPIQGDMVHPYLRRRSGAEQVVFPRSRHEAAHGQDSRIAEVLGRTLGVPIFQEQVMKLVEVVAGFSAGKADQLRRAMAAWKRRGGLEPFREEIRDGMLANGYEEAYFEQIFSQIQGFGDYGFPESHSASFALLAYASAWLKCHHPVVFSCALLNSQPMGFYAPAQLIQDLRQHGHTVRPVDVLHSAWECTLEPLDAGRFALRLGFSSVRGLSVDLAQRISDARAQAPFVDLADLLQRVQPNRGERARLADADALRNLGGHRHQARWASAGYHAMPPLLAAAAVHEETVTLQAPSLREEVLGDYASVGLSLRSHPMALLRDSLAEQRVLCVRDVLASRSGRRLRSAGLVTVRQRPGTAKGVTFLTLEDETGTLNVVVWQALAERQRRVLLEAVVLGVDGVLESSDGVQHLIARRLASLDHLLPELASQSRDFH
ncbi:MAG: error-prone DNA polymerase [Dokdonella sp.]